jgi:hypothetical protein
MQNVEMWCWSLYRDRDFHTRFHFDHYELSGQWHGEFCTTRTFTYYTVKKGARVSRPQPGCHYQTLPGLE